MRNVAVVLALISLAALLPQGQAGDECSTIATSGQVCTTFSAERPILPPPASAPQTPYWGKYYLFFGGTQCTSPTSSMCRGAPSAPGSGVPLPTGGSVPATGATFGVLYRESGFLPGLQRGIWSSGVEAYKDYMVLV